MSEAEDALQARLLAAQEKRKALAAGRGLAALEQQATDEEKLAELEAAYPNGFAIVYLNAPLDGCPGFAAARDCNPAEYKRFKSGVKVTVVKGAADVDSGDGNEQLGRSCLIYPDADVFKRMNAARPGLEAGLGQEVVRRAQTRQADDAKK